MTIRNQASFTSSLPDWAMLDGCFGCGGIRPTDIDGCVERGGVCLFLEHKRSDGTVSIAQDIAFDAIRGQGNTVLVFWGDAPDGSDISRIRRYSPGHPAYDERSGGLQDLRKLASYWFDNCPKPVKRWRSARKDGNR